MHNSAQKPLLSVVIPAYNEEKVIRKCLEALTKQTLDRSLYEIIIVDNGSTDKTASIAKQYGVEVLPYTREQSPVYAREYGSEQARAPLFAYSDADSIVAKDWLEIILHLFENKDLVCVGGSISSCSSDKLIISLFRFFDGLALLLQHFGISLIWGPNMAVRADAFRKINGFNTNMRTGDDWDFVMRLQKMFGRTSVLYSSHLKAKTSPRKQEKLRLLIPYIWIGILNFFSIHIFHLSKSVGKQVLIR